MTDPRRVAVVCGGSSAEAEVSRDSGAQVADALREGFEEVRLLEHGPALARGLDGVEVVFPVMHGPPGEDGTLQGFLSTLGLPYVGSGVLASAVAMHKPTARAVFAAAGLPVAAGLEVAAGQDPEVVCARVATRLGSRVVAKPASSGSALGVERCAGPEQLTSALDRSRDEPLLVETWVQGAEVTVGVLERDDGLQALPVVEVRTPDGGWYDFDHRYTPGLSEHVVPADLPTAQLERLAEIGLAAHRALGCRDLSRADLVVEPGGGAVLLEVNTLPGMTPTSLYPDAAAAAGHDFASLVAGLVRRAWGRREHGA